MMDNLLADVSLFETLSSEDLSPLLKSAELRLIQKDTVVVSEGEDTNSLFIIQTGKVKIYLSDDEGKEVLLHTQGPGDYFGEVSLLDEAPRTASVKTLEKSTFYVISKDEFKDFLLNNPEISIRVIIGITRRLRNVTENMKSLALMDVYGRIASTLMKLAEQSDDKLVIDRRLTHREIASMVGSSREMVSRVMKDLVSGGYVTVSKSGITINKKLPARW